MCFFFQAEDGIRDLTVTGVQTCALPIFHPPESAGGGAAGDRPAARRGRGQPGVVRRPEPGRDEVGARGAPGPARGRLRSEERRVGKECRSRRSPDERKKKDKEDSRRTTE